MELRWLDPEHPDPRDVDAAVAVLDVCRAVDEPFAPAVTVDGFLGNLRYGWEAGPREIAVAWADGHVVGVLDLHRPRWDNPHIGEVGVQVDPWRRRQGHGRELLEAAVRYLRDAGRTTFVGASLSGPGDAFGKAMGWRAAAVEEVRRQDPGRLDWPAIERLATAAQPSAQGYELMRIGPRTPEELLPAVATMMESINDAPFDDLDLHDIVYTPERVRTFEASMVARSQRWRRVVAREKATGVLAGHTMAGVAAQQPGFGYQGDTSVVAAHRGHRLGLLLKVEMLRWLAEEEPQLRSIDTGNAASNPHMISINEQLGYRKIATQTVWQLS